MVQSYINLGDFFSNESYSTTTFNSYADFAELGRTPPKPLALEQHYGRPVFHTDLSDSDSEDDDFDIALLDLPPELFLNAIFPQMSLRTLGAFALVSTYTRQLVEMSRDWDALYSEDFNDTVPVAGSGFSRYIKRANARSLVSANLEKGSNLVHSALTSNSKTENDILQMSLSHHSNKTYQSPFKALQINDSISTWATANLVLTSNHQVAQITKDGKLHVLKCARNTNISKLEASFALSHDGVALRLVFDDERNLVLEPIAFEHRIYDITSIKNRVYALAQDVGLITWLSGDEKAGQFDLVLSTSLRFKSFSIYEHNYGALAEVALTINDCIYTLQFDRTANSAGIYHTLDDCRRIDAVATKVTYYDEGAFLVLGADGAVAKLARGQLVPVPCLKGIADFVVSKLGFCMALTTEGSVLSWDCRSRRAASTWAIGTTIKGTKVPISSPVKAKIEGTVTSIFCCDEFAFAQVV